MQSEEVIGLPQYSNRPEPRDRGTMVSVKHPEYVQPGVRDFGAPEAGEEEGVVGEGLVELEVEEEGEAARMTGAGEGEPLSCVVAPHPLC